MTTYAPPLPPPPPVRSSRRAPSRPPPPPLGRSPYTLPPNQQPHSLGVPPPPLASFSSSSSDRELTNPTLRFSLVPVVRASFHRFENDIPRLERREREGERGENIIAVARTTRREQWPSCVQRCEAPLDASAEREKERERRRRRRRRRRRGRSGTRYARHVSSSPSSGGVGGSGGEERRRKRKLEEARRCRWRG